MRPGAYTSAETASHHLRHKETSIACTYHPHTIPNAFSKALVSRPSAAAPLSGYSEMARHSCVVLGLTLPWAIAPATRAIGCSLPPCRLRQLRHELEGDVGPSPTGGRSWSWAAGGPSRVLDDIEELVRAVGGADGGEGLGHQAAEPFERARDADLRRYVVRTPFSVRT